MKAPAGEMIQAWTWNPSRFRLAALVTRAVAAEARAVAAEARTRYAEARPYPEP